MESARRDVERSYEEIWAGGAEEEHKPVILTWRLSQSLWEYHGVALVRVYDSDGKELARSQMSKGVACPYGTATYSWTILPDLVLTEEEQVALAQRLSKERSLSWFYGTAGGLFEDQAGEGLYCEVTGVADEQRQVIYPQKLTYVYQDHTVTLIDSTSDFFADKELTTLRFDAVQLASALEGIKASPRELLRCYRQAEENLEKLLPSGTPSMSSVSVSSSGSTCAPMGEDAILASAYAYAPLPTALMGLGPTAVLTLLAAIVLAVFTDRRQRQALQRERAFTRAAAHELKTPLAVLRTHAEALREDIDPARRQEYLGVVVEESDRMAALVGSLMDLARLESGVKTEGEPLDLTALVEGSAARLELLAQQKGIGLTTQLAPAAVWGDKLRLEELVDNLTDNALRHCTPGGRVTIALEQVGKQVTLTVDNDGHPIPPEHLLHIWEPFYRGDKSRSRLPEPFRQAFRQGKDFFVLFCRIRFRFPERRNVSGDGFTQIVNNAHPQHFIQVYAFRFSRKEHCHERHTPAVFCHAFRTPLTGGGMTGIVFEPFCQMQKINEFSRRHASFSFSSAFFQHL